MDFIKQIVEYVQANWIQISVALWLVEQALRAVSELTPWKWDDNLVKILAKILKNIFPKKATDNG